jgi:hypothetical protein
MCFAFGAGSREVLRAYRFCIIFLQDACCFKEESSDGGRSCPRSTACPNQSTGSMPKAPSAAGHPGLWRPGGMSALGAGFRYRLGTWRSDRDEPIGLDLVEDEEGAHLANAR